MHETHIGYTWKRTQQTPTSTTPSLEVAGYFTGGGATSQNLNDRERNLEIDDDVMFTHGIHSFRTWRAIFGVFRSTTTIPTRSMERMSLAAAARRCSMRTTVPRVKQPQLPRSSNINGRSRTSPEGAPTTYQAINGTPLVSLSQWRVALYGEDTIKLAPRFTMSAGLRYSFQTSPETFLNFAPRLAFSWAVDKKSTWIISLRSGIFDAPAPVSYATEVNRLNGTRQQSILVYSPSYGTPLTPVAGSIQVATMNQFRPSVFEFPAAATQISIEHDLPLPLASGSEFYLCGGLGDLSNPEHQCADGCQQCRGRPLIDRRTVGSTAHRAQLEHLQYENTGHLNGHVANFTLAQTSYKRFNFNLSTWWVDFNRMRRSRSRHLNRATAIEVSPHGRIGSRAAVLSTAHCIFP